eukprot:TRINITY_DN3840_c0_g1_i1.p1 TRINITY_DN3840_c0_g1~~TRINITY_DN3840_c0_g1_i1.p1  ORF type:complete len:413 (+),score=70.48 TRINITY_DN3840_c0_g1_i1:64-1239(+)
MRNEAEIHIVQDPPVSILVLRHQLPAAETIDCRTFLTNGLRNLNNHREIAFTFKLTDDQLKKEVGLGEDENGFDFNEDLPDGLVDLLRGILTYASSGSTANGGDMTRLDPVGGSGLFNNDFRGILYIPCNCVGLPDDALQALAITREEVEAVDQVGAVRVMAAFGNINRFFPSTIWIDTERSTFITSKDWVDDSVLVKMFHPPTAPKPSAFIFLQNRIEGGEMKKTKNTRTGLNDVVWHNASGSRRVLLIYNENLRDALKNSKQSILKRNSEMFSLFTHPTNEAVQIITRPLDNANPDSLNCIVSPLYNPDQPVMNLLGNYFCFLKLKEDKWGGRQVEDGFVIFVPSLERVMDAIINGEDLSIAPSDPNEYLSVQLLYCEGYDGFKASHEE